MKKHERRVAVTFWVVFLTTLYLGVVAIDSKVRDMQQWSDAAQWEYWR